MPNGTVVLPTVLAMLGPVFTRRHVALERLATNNEVAGFKFAAVAVLYAVLLAFAVIVVWERFSEAKSNVTKEAGAAATIYRLSQGISGEPGVALREALTNYLKATISDRMSAAPCKPHPTLAEPKDLRERAPWRASQ